MVADLSVFTRLRRGCVSAVTAGRGGARETWRAAGFSARLPTANFPRQRTQLLAGFFLSAPIKLRTVLRALVGRHSEVGARP
jgi:hypothetical protein